MQVQIKNLKVNDFFKFNGGDLYQRTNIGDCPVNGRVECRDLHDDGLVWFHEDTIVDTYNPNVVMYDCPFCGEELPLSEAIDNKHTGDLCCQRCTDLDPDKWSLSALNYSDAFMYDGVRFELCDPYLIDGDFQSIPDYLECLNTEAEEYVELPSHLQVKLA